MFVFGRLLAAAQPLEPGARLVVERVGEAGAVRLAAGLGCSSSARKAGDERFCTSCPEVPRTAKSEETRQTCSVARCSAASRSSSASAWRA